MLIDILQHLLIRAIANVDTDTSLVFMEAMGADNRYYVYTKSVQHDDLNVFDQEIDAILPNSLVVSNQYVFVYVRMK